MRTRLERLSPEDLTNLAVEAADTPMHIGVVAVPDGWSLLDGDRRVRLADLRSHIEGGLGQVPLLRKLVYRPGVLAGRPVWVDDPAWASDIRTTTANALPSGIAWPGCEPRLTASADGAARASVFCCFCCLAPRRACTETQRLWPETAEAWRGLCRYFNDLDPTDPYYTYPDLQALVATGPVAQT